MFKIHEVRHAGKKRKCADRLCKTKVKTGDDSFLDVAGNTPKVFCRQCGLCLRYARKKAAERGERAEEMTEY